ncbi:SMP-30/gluconolactonase/LRE family protein [Bremerella sp. T1]|uniref:SMP-30/gluconolactonase/LRE family protein n=1 Tax=Bremerella sp. TYQ1 TaxID=3119568 RepID=UPI001CCBA8E5|nr:SMP-30/gluconolactonase/LRE family protein [Bremerella volcania]UBM36695.1 SMP-30/gluconolactonase/LRE family protein [Bremerella volcania]
MATSKPYATMPITLPGRIEIEQFDRGGEGVAYHDNDRKNLGNGQLNLLFDNPEALFRRSEGVDLSFTKLAQEGVAGDRDINGQSEPEGAIYLGWTKPGEWIRYTVHVQKSGRYRISGHVASANEGASCAITFDRNQGKTLIALPRTGSGHRWKNDKYLGHVDLVAGDQTLTIEVGDIGGFNIDWLELKLDTDGEGNESPVRRFPVQRLRNIHFRTVAKFDWFPEGPAYRKSDNRFFFSGANALTRVDLNGELHAVLLSPGGGGVHFLPDDSALIIGQTGLRRVYPDGRVALLVDGKTIGPGNDLSIGIHGEIYFSVPNDGIYRLTAGQDGRLQRVCGDRCNGLEVDPSGKYLYVAGSRVQRYPLDIARPDLGKPEVIYEFPKGQGGGDGCAFDAWGNFYSMHFRTGTIRIFDPHQKTLLGEIPVGVVPASNLTFGGSDQSQLFVTAGAPKTKNCQVRIADIGIQGFLGHPGDTSYPMLHFLD